MGKLFKMIVLQKKTEIKKSKNNNIKHIHNNNNNSERINVCHSCKCQITEYETFYFFSVPYCPLCYVLLAYTL